MAYLALANRTKSDGKLVVVRHSLTAINTREQRDRLCFNSLEFNEGTQIHVVTTSVLFPDPLETSKIISSLSTS